MHWRTRSTGCLQADLGARKGRSPVSDGVRSVGSGGSTGYVDQISCRAGKSRRSGWGIAESDEDTAKFLTIRCRIHHGARQNDGQQVRCRGDYRGSSHRAVCVASAGGVGDHAGVCR